jgi:tripartite ATP-independent transporter DctM subunit
MGAGGFELLIDSVYGSLSVFVLLPITMFILQGEILFRTGLVTKMIDALDSWMGAVPGRLALLAVGSGTILASLSGASIGTTAMLTRTLAPAMQERGYSKKMSVGPLLGSGGLAVMMPHSALGVILAVIAGVSVGKLLIAIIIPGFLLALCYVIYIVGVCAIDPNEAPKYAAKKVPLNERLVLTAKYVVPLTALIVAMIAVIFFGVATPTEAASLGTFASFALAAIYGRLTWAATRDAMFSTLKISVMVLAILAASQAFTQLLAYSGSAQKLVLLAGSLPIPPIWIIVLMHFVTLLLGGPIGGIPLIIRSDLVLHRDAAERRTRPDHAAVWYSALRGAWDYAEHLDGRNHARRRSHHRHSVDCHGHVDRDSEPFALAPQLHEPITRRRPWLKSRK